MYQVRHTGSRTGISSFSPVNVKEWEGYSFYCMKEYRGKSVHEGIAFGSVCFFDRGYTDIVRVDTAYPQIEIKRFETAVTKTVLELQELCEKAGLLVGDEKAEIFEMQKMIALDDLLAEDVKKYILDNSCNAEYALSKAANDYTARISLLADELLRARNEDCLDVFRKILKHMSNDEAEEPVLKQPVILLATDISPGETINLDKEKVLAIVLLGGSEYSHTAILAKSLDIPCIVQTDVICPANLHGKEAGVDGKEGLFYVEPTEEIITELKEKQRQIRKRLQNLQNMVGLESRTKDGRLIRVFANIETPDDLPKVKEQDAEGIGLFRTEFLYLSRSIYPEEEEQFAVYRDVIAGMEGRPVIIRTLDIGADKTVPYLSYVKEDNPAMGMRGIRLCLAQKQLFLIQLKALLRASAYGNVSVMFPMISSVWEIQTVNELILEAKKILTEEGKNFGNPKMGIMIETPAAVVIAEELAEYADFFSIGTNDLTQYTLAADRTNPAMDIYTNPYHEAVLRLIEMTVKSGHKKGIPVGICGDLAADLTMTELFIRLGVDELSIPAGKVLSLRKKIRSLDCTEKKGKGK